MLDAEEPIDDLGWLAPSQPDVKTRTSRKRRIRAELVRWLEFYERMNMPQFAEDQREAIRRLDAGEVLDSLA
jgi:hypothetical protein